MVGVLKVEDLIRQSIKGTSMWIMRCLQPARPCLYKVRPERPMLKHQFQTYQRHWQISFIFLTKCYRKKIELASLYWTQAQKSMNGLEIRHSPVTTDPKWCMSWVWRQQIVFNLLQRQLLADFGNPSEEASRGWGLEGGVQTLTLSSNPHHFFPSSGLPLPTPSFSVSVLHWTTTIRSGYLDSLLKLISWIMLLWLWLPDPASHLQRNGMLFRQTWCILTSGRQQTIPH